MKKTKNAARPTASQGALDGDEDPNLKRSEPYRGEPCGYHDLQVADLEEDSKERPDEEVRPCYAIGGGLVRQFDTWLNQSPNQAFEDWANGG